MDAISKSVHKFSYDLLKEILKSEQKKNIIYSPFSIVIALKMVMSGANGQTKSQMEKVLHLLQECPSLKECEEELQSDIKGLLSNQKDKKYELNIVNGLFGEKTFTFLDQYVQLLKKEYNAELQTVDFKKNADPERQKINEWVKCLTNGKITNLYGEGSLNESSVIALVNTIYFKGQWAKKFNPENTREGTFHVNKNEKKTVKMMSKSGKFKFLALPELKSKALMLPYEGDLSMIIVLPDEVDGVNELLSKANPDLLTTWAQRKNLREKEVDVILPKFKLEHGYELVQPLKSLGMTDLFQSKADLSGMSNTKGLVVSNLAHKSYIEVNEEGTEAAAATAVGIGVTSLPIRESFNADHPFIFFILRNSDFLIFFQGVLFSP
ncbi:serpin B3-like [Anomaloglossus baeobatrachus]|uniref:serpin B3-like n=1 Tax=Anomaloglossus baeobatrachus TaxID=238106 RepID=UPI003F50D12A